MLRPSPGRCPQAYLKWRAEGGRDRQLPGLELTLDQIFFISYAQVGAMEPLFTCSQRGSALSIFGRHPRWGTP